MSNYFPVHFLLKCVFRILKMGETCNICSKIFKNKPGVIAHKAAVHYEKKHACNVCDKKKDQLNTHLSTHQDPIDICYQCGITFTHKTNLAKHRKSYHLPQNHKCNSCSQSFIDKTLFWLNSPISVCVSHTHIHSLSQNLNHKTSHLYYINWRP